MSDRIAEIRERWENATPGPWGIAPWHDCTVGSKAWLDWDARDIVGEDHPEGEFNAITTSTQADAEFIAHAPDDIAFLLAEVERLTAERDSAQSAMRTHSCGERMTNAEARLSAITDALDREKLAQLIADENPTRDGLPKIQDAMLAEVIRRHVLGEEEQ